VIFANSHLTLGQITKLQLAEVLSHRIGTRVRLHRPALSRTTVNQKVDPSPSCDVTSVQSRTHALCLASTPWVPKWDNKSGFRDNRGIT